MAIGSYAARTEQEWLLQLRQGNQHAFASIYKEYFDFLLVYAFKLTKVQEESEDLVQQVFTQLWSGRESINIHGSLLAYLYQSIRFAFIDQARRKQSFSAYKADLSLFSDRVASAEEELRLKELVRKITDIANRLPGKMGQVFLLAHFNGLSNAEIAQALDISERTVQNLMSKAQKDIRLKIGFAFMLFLAGILSL